MTDFQTRKFRRKSLSPISRLVDILPDEAFDKAAAAGSSSKESLANMGRQVTDPSVTKPTSEPAPSNDARGATSDEGKSRPETFPVFGKRSGRRLSVTSRIQAMLKDTAKEPGHQR